MRRGRSRRAPGGRPSRCERLHQMVDVLRWLDLGEDMLDPAVRTDDEGGALVSEVRPAGELLLDPDAEGLGHPVPIVREETVGQRVFLTELHVALHAVGGDTEELDAGAGHAGPAVTKATRLGGAAGRVVLRVEVEDVSRAVEGLARHGAAVIRGHFEGRNRVAGAQSGHAWKSSPCSVPG